MSDLLTIINGDCLKELAKLPDESVHCCVCSPPYFGLRSYGIGTENGEIGLEPSPAEYVEKLVAVFREVRRVLRKDGTVWINLGSSYAGSGRGGNPEDSPFRKQATNVGSLVTPNPMLHGNETFALRDDLTISERAYVFAQLARVFQGDKVTEPNFPISVHEAVAPFADSAQI